MENFTPLAALIGGAMIGLSAIILMAFNGRIAGISGVFSGTLFAKTGDKAWRIYFILGLIAAPLLYRLASGTPLPFEMSANMPITIIAGLLVGFGTRLGSGCTSGHGICGLSRLSVRSLVSVALFMGVGFITVAVAKMIIGV
ncbi:MAG: YeeE/YedE thiosulfate transporter family protein [Parvularculaceae bacterium]